MQPTYSSSSLYTLSPVQFAFYATSAWVAALAVVIGMGMNAIDTFLPLQFALVFFPLYLLNRRFSRRRNMSFRRRLTLNAVYGFSLTLLFAGVQLFSQSVLNTSLLPERFMNTAVGLAAPAAMLSMLTFAWVVVSVFICMVLFRNRMGFRRV